MEKRSRNPGKTTDAEEAILSGCRVATHLYDALDRPADETALGALCTRLIAGMVASEAFAMLVVGRDGTVVDADDRFLRLAGQERGAVNGGHLRLRDLVPADRLADVEAAVFRPDATRRNAPCATPLVGRNGTTVPVRLSACDLGNGTVAAFVAEAPYHGPTVAAGLRETVERIGAAEDAAGIRLFDWHIGLADTARDAGASQAPGMVEGAFGGAYEAWVAAIHPEDVAEATSSIEAGLLSGLLEGQWRVVRPDGAIRWILVRGRVEYDSLSRPCRITGAELDVTEKVRGEEDLKFLITEFDRQIEDLRRQLRRGGA